MRWGMYGADINSLKGSREGGEAVCVAITRLRAPPGRASPRRRREQWPG